jgi:hypothetical protein
LHDEVVKSELLTSWLDQHDDNRVCLAELGQPIDRSAALRSIETIVARTAGAEWLYIVVADEDPPVPLYVGRTTAPLVRWKSHLASLARGAGVYARWRESMLDSQGRARCRLPLVLVADSAIIGPPIPGFPSTVGAVEYQLVSLAGDAYGRLLNLEGNRR